MPFTLATFNVKDLFDAPESAAGKATALGAMLARVDADVLALEEVGSAAALDAALACAPPLGYAARVLGTPDKRGIRNALLSRFPLVASRVLTAASLEFPRFQAGDPPPFDARIPLRRGIVHARVAAPGGEVDVLVAHLKSRRVVPLKDAAGEPIEPATDRELAEGMLRSLVTRASEALFLRAAVDALFAADPRARIAVAGDMNDTWGSLPLRVLSGAGATYLAPCAERVPVESCWSIWHDGERTQIDHILASPALFARLEAAWFLNEELRDHSRLPPEAHPTPDSDHAPLVARFS